MGLSKALVAASERRARRRLDREQIIADALVDVASELRLTDAAELVALIRNDHAANIADLVNSSSELFFRSGTLRYALSASVAAPWDGTPRGRLRPGVPPCQDCRVLPPDDRSNGCAGIEIMDVLFDEKGLDEGAKAERLVAAFAAARRPKESA